MIIREQQFNKVSEKIKKTNKIMFWGLQFPLVHLLLIIYIM